MNKRKLAIIGANDFQNQLIIKAKSRGIETHVFAWEEGAVGEKTADYFYPISIIEKEAILEQCMKIKIDAIASIASDLASITVNFVAEKMGLIGNGMESAMISTNKYLMRQAFANAGDPSPCFYCSDQLPENIVEHLRFPVIVKPVDRSGSRGICKIENKKELEKAIKYAEQLSFDHKAMIEEFVEGQEYSVEYLSYKGKHYFMALTQKYTTGAPHFIEVAHRQPVNMSEEMLDKIKVIVEHALDTLKIRYGASHSEIKIDNCGNIKIIEIGGRMGGDCIGSDLVQLSTGYDYVNLVIDVAFGEKPVFQKVSVPKQAEVRFIFNQMDMFELKKIEREKPECLYRVSEITAFDETHEITDSSTRYGYYIIQGDQL